MFDEKLNRAIDEAQSCIGEGVYNPYLDGIKQSICEYIEAVNSVIYHTIHTDQVYLMIPGYSGTSFSIPIKLNMMYLWLTDGVARLFGKTNRKYQCIVVPTMESKPVTKTIKFEQSPDNFLVCVKISQRTLYMPKALMIILAHEMGHYIGGDLRCRELRCQKMVTYTSTYISDALFPQLEKGDILYEISGVIRNEFQKEAFSDIVAVKLLQYDKQAFEEAMCISEGMNVFVEESIRREKVMTALGEKIGWNETQEADLAFNDKLLLEYVETCNDWLNSKLRADGERLSLLNDVRSLYKLFEENDGRDRIYSCYQVYDSIVNRIMKLKQNIDSEMS